MTSKQAEQVQPHAGVDPAELIDQEIAQAMDELGIEKQEVTDADQEAKKGIPSDGWRWLFDSRPRAADQHPARTTGGPSGARRCV